MLDSPGNVEDERVGFSTRLKGAVSTMIVSIPLGFIVALISVNIQELKIYPDVPVYVTLGVLGTITLSGLIYPKPYLKAVRILRGVADIGDFWPF